MKVHQEEGRSGFTLIELLIAVAIIGIIAAILIPNFIDALQRSRQKRTVGDMRIAGEAMVSWITDHGGAGAAGATTQQFDISEWTGVSDVEALRALLIPDYVQQVPATDGWDHPYLFRFDVDDPGKRRGMLVVSGGLDNVIEGSYQYGTFEATDYIQDIVWADGRFIRLPDK